MQGRGQGRARPPVVPNRRPGLEPDINNAQRMQDGDPEYWIWDEWWPYTPPTPAYPPPVGHPDYYVGYPGLLVPTASYSPHLHSMRSNAISTRPHYGPVRAPVHPGLPPWAVSAGPAGYDNSQTARAGQSLDEPSEADQQGRRRQQGARGTGDPPSLPNTGRAPRNSGTNENSTWRQADHRIPLRATRKLYVDHIQETCTIEDLIFVFANHGQVNDAHLDGEGDLRYGIILFDTVNAAQSAVAELHNQIIRRLSDTRHPDPAKRRLVVKYRRESERHVKQERRVREPATLPGSNVHNTNGHNTNDHNSNGHNTNGHNTNGHNTNDHDPIGHNTNGHNTNGHNTNGHNFCGRPLYTFTAGKLQADLPKDESCQATSAQTNPADTLASSVASLSLDQELSQPKSDDSLGSWQLEGSPPKGL